MKIKKATIRSVELPSIDKISPLIEEQEFTPLGENFSVTSGFEKNEITGDLVTPIPGLGYSFTIRLDQKIIPAAVLKTATEEKIKEIEATQGRKVRQKESREIKAEIYSSLIKTAPIKSTRVISFYNDTAKRLLIIASTQALAQLVTDKLLKLTGVRATPCAIGNSEELRKITADLSNFVLHKEASFGDFNPGDSVSLKSPLKGAAFKGSATFNPQTLDYAQAGIKEAIAVGMMVSKIELEYQAMTFKVGNDIDVLTSIEDFGALSDDEKASREDLDKAELWRIESAAQVLMILDTHSALIARYATTK
jgi:recombination associated protein RdgC